MRYGFIRNLDRMEPTIEEQKQMIKSVINRIVVEKEPYQIQSNKLKELIAKMEPGDTLVVATFKVLGITTKQFLELCHEFKTKNLEIYIKDIQIFTGNKKNEKFFEIMEYLRVSEIELQRERALKASVNNPLIGARKAINDDDVKMAVELRKQGHSYQEITEKTGISKSTVWRYFKEYEDAEREEMKSKRRKLDNALVQEMIKLLDEGVSQVDIAEKLNISNRTVSKYAKLHLNNDSKA